MLLPVQGLDRRDHLTHIFASSGPEFGPSGAEVILLAIYLLLSVLLWWEKRWLLSVLLGWGGS